VGPQDRPWHALAGALVVLSCATQAETCYRITDIEVRVPGIYGNQGNPLPKRMSPLVLPAPKAVKKAYGMIASEGGPLCISDMFRSARAQQRAHEDWKSGRKSAYNPPSCGSVHKAARAPDIDAFDTGIGHRGVR
jgi:hypothetical protein